MTTTDRPTSAVAGAADAWAGLSTEAWRGLPVGLVALDSRHRVVSMNPAAQDVLGASCEELPGRLARGVLDTPAPDFCAVLSEARQAGQPARLDPIRFLGDGERVFTLRITVVPMGTVRAADGDGFLVSLEDVTALAELEQRVAKAEGMAAVGRLAAKVAHELNNPLDGALRYLGLCSRLVTSDASDPERVAGYLEETRLGLLRMARIVSELLEFSRSMPMAQECGNINQQVEEAIRALGAHADRNGVSVAAGFHDDNRMPTLEGAKLYQVCCNLIKNAIDAMPEGGYLTVTTGLVEGEVVIKFEDTGVGLPEDVESVFEPFFTTKAAGKGTGLGLAICREYVEQLGGTIVAESGKPKGSVFTIRLPDARRPEGQSGGQQGQQG